MLYRELGSKIIIKPKINIITPAKIAAVPLTLKVVGCSSIPIKRLFLYTVIMPEINRHNPRNRHAKAVSTKDKTAKMIRIKVATKITPRGHHH